MTLLDKILLNARHAHDEDGEFLIFRCEHHGEIHNPLRPRNSRCVECWTVTFLAQQCLSDDVAKGTESLHKFDEAAHKIGESARRGDWDYRPSKAAVRYQPENPDRGTIELTDFS